MDTSITGQGPGSQALESDAETMLEDDVFDDPNPTTIDDHFDAANIEHSLQIRDDDKWDDSDSDTSSVSWADLQSDHPMDEMLVHCPVVMLLAKCTNR